MNNLIKRLIAINYLVLILANLLYYQRLQFFFIAYTLIFSYAIITDFLDLKFYK